jgi:cell wall-associated NlpC family hydrolase
MSGIPLDPGAGGQSILSEALEVADIIVSTTGARITGAIRAGSLSRVSHAMLYIGQGRVVEAIDEGVTIRSLQSAISTGRPAVAYRRNGLSGGGAERVAQWARDREDARYDLAGRGSPLLLPSHHPGLRGGR